MIDDDTITVPDFYDEIAKKSKAINFNMLSDLQTGSLLRTLAASKPHGMFLEIGTGTGLSLTWLAEGADQNSSIITVDNNKEYQQIARKALGNDARIEFVCADGNEWLSSYSGEKFDLIFADAWPGKFERLDEALALVKPGGFYLIDDLLPQPNWGEGHQANVDALLQKLHQHTDFVRTVFNWSTGLILFTRIK